MTIPKYSSELIEELYSIYQEQRITPDLTIEEIMFKAGKRELVKELMEDLRLQQEDSTKQGELNG